MRQELTEALSASLNLTGVISPGEYLQLLLRAKRMLLSELADAASVKPTLLSGVLYKGAPLTVSTALKLESAIDVSADHLIELEVLYRADLVLKQQLDDLALLRKGVSVKPSRTSIKKNRLQTQKEPQEGLGDNLITLDSSLSRRQSPGRASQ